MPPDPPEPSPHARERGASVVEYVGLGAVTSMLVSGVAAALDSAVGDRLGAAIVRKLLAAVSGME
ncbi:MAG: hypothetical protein JWM86_1865 [Thermoleophilia bacterium]|nr:hypothetical protein [Thermoleophilia bacterium]